MGRSYDKYFLDRDISSAKAELMFGIKNHVTYGIELTRLIEDLEKHNLLEKNPLKKKPQDQWTPEYARFLATGFASGYFSRAYLVHCAEVAEYLHKKKKSQKTLLTCGIAVLVIIGLIMAFCRS